LSIKAGLRAKEIASLTWRMVTDARGQIGQSVHLEDSASKGRSGRVIPMNEELRRALRDVQVLAGHTNLRTTQRYIEANTDAQARIVELI
jgi:integrase